MGEFLSLEGCWSLLLFDDHKPLYLLDEYYEFRDLEGIFHYPISLDQINDDRFGGFLDRFHEAECRKIFSDIAAKVFIRYNIKIGNINFDTTSKVMWGLYETDEEPKGVIKIDFGHSKDKREDKKQLKIGIGCAEGIVADAVVLSGNKDDKTYNSDNFDNLKEVMQPNNTKGKERKYGIAEKVENCRGIPLKLAICYSHGLMETKNKSKKRRKSLKSFHQLFQNVILPVLKMQKKFHQLKSPHFVSSIQGLKHLPI